MGVSLFRCEDAEDLAGRNNAYGPNEEDSTSWSDLDIEDLRASLPSAEVLAAADLQSVSDRSHSLEQTYDSPDSRRPSGDYSARETASQPDRSSLHGTLGTAAELGSSFDGGVSVSESLLRDYSELDALRAGIPTTIQEDSAYLQQLQSAAENRRSVDINRKAKSLALKALRQYSAEGKPSRHSLQVPAEAAEAISQPRHLGGPSPADGLLLAGLESLTTDVPKGRCSCALKRHYEERARLSQDIGQDVPFTSSDRSFAELMAANQYSLDAPYTSAPGQASSIEHQDDAVGAEVQWKVSLHMPVFK